MQALTGEDEEDEDESDGAEGKQLYRVSDESGEVNMTLVKEENITEEDFISNDVFILDANQEVFVWVGSGASSAEKRNGLSYAQKHLARSGHPFVPVSVIKEGRVSEAFVTAIAA
jgi:gelsolin